MHVNENFLLPLQIDPSETVSISINNKLMQWNKEQQCISLVKHGPA